MIPRKLELRNFLSYGDDVQSVDFRNYSLVCFSGKNGNGKSALLDAMTWVLWGQARKISGTIKADDGLLRLGQTRMMVSLEFELEQKIYRVRREYAKTHGKPYSSLAIELFDQEDDRYISLSDKTIRKTQEKIERLLGIDFETFVNSAFLKQGQSDEFSKRTPKERKQILATILGLSKYEHLQQRALDKVKKYLDEKKLLNKLQEQAIQEIEKTGNLEKELKNEKLLVEKVVNEILDLQKRFSEIEEEKKCFDEKKRGYDFVAKEINLVGNKINVQQKNLCERISEWKKTYYKSLKLPDVQKLEQKKNELTKKEHHFLKIQQKGLDLKEKILVKRHRYQELYHKIKQEQDKLVTALQLDREKKELQCKQIFLLLGELQ